MSMVAAPYTLWIVWDETDGPIRQSHYARVIGWLDVTEHQAVRSRPGSPLPVVIHPETQLPATLGWDGPASVSRMQVIGDYMAGPAAKATRDQRQTKHGGDRG